MEKLRLMDVVSCRLWSLQMASWVYWRLLVMKGNIPNKNGEKWELKHLHINWWGNNKCLHSYCDNVTFCGIVSLWPFEHVNPSEQVESWIESPGWLNVFCLSDRWIEHVVPFSRIPFFLWDSTLFSLVFGLWFIVHQTFFPRFLWFCCWFHGFTGLRPAVHVCIFDESRTAPKLSDFGWFPIGSMWMVLFTYIYLHLPTFTYIYHNKRTIHGSVNMHQPHDGSVMGTNAEDGCSNPYDEDLQVVAAWKK